MLRIVTTPAESIEATLGLLLSKVNGAGLSDSGGVNVNGASPKSLLIALKLESVGVARPICTVRDSEPAS